MTERARPIPTTGLLVALPLALLALLCVGATARAADAIAASPPASEAAVEPPTVRAAFDAAIVRAAATAPHGRWRARGLAFVDLPHGLRARYDAQALLALPSSDDLMSTLFDPPSAAPQRRNRLLESRFALSRIVAPRVEVEVSWATRSPLSVVDLVRIEDQRVSAMIRFVP
ncbi:MAG: hypothetical protein R3F35_13770 [Myxococcota bacterium]